MLREFKTVEKKRAIIRKQILKGDYQSSLYGEKKEICPLLPEIYRNFNGIPKF
jgi:hypothetical protein